MMRNSIARGIGIALMVMIACVVMGFIVMGLWNWLMPPLFGLRVITFWQALGLLLLSKLLFGGFRGGRGYRGRRSRNMRDRWKQMTPEQREQFRKGMQGWCSSFRAPAEERKVGES
ncbi:MAG TPA: hypothetical protein VG759_03120 [Candidatus Angelobacter sp.]|jgi:hypothetical protein|nr:hypothetical protein [Candidatus Angelobacter sp.]